LILAGTMFLTCRLHNFLSLMQDLNQQNNARSNSYSVLIFFCLFRRLSTSCLCLLGFSYLGIKGRFGRIISPYRSFWLAIRYFYYYNLSNSSVVVATLCLADILKYLGEIKSAKN
jgi:hypothetical protein